MLNSVLQFRRLSVMLGVTGLLLTGCSGDIEESAVEESDSGTELLETQEEVLEVDRVVADDVKSDEAEPDGEFSDIMAGERQMFLDAQRKYDEEMARQKAEGESGDK